MILITGATGFIGRHLVSRLLASNYRVRCLLPPDTNYKWDATTQPDIIHGTPDDSETLFRAMTGIHTVIHLQSAQWWGTPQDLQRIDINGTRHLVEAARAARVGRIIMMSHLGATPSSAYPLLQVKGVVEDIIRSSGLAYTIIRAGLVFGEDDAFYNHIAMSLALNPVAVFIPGRGEVVLHPIYIQDIVGALAQTLENMDTVDTIIEIGGPEYISLMDLTRTIMRVTGRRRIIVRLPPYLIRWLNRVVRLWTLRTLTTPQWLDLLATNRVAQLGNLAQYYTIDTHRLEDTMQTYMPGNYGWFRAVRYLLRRRPRRHF
jgi:uncharacterized protein YbjT (DUF2867 family)